MPKGPFLPSEFTATQWSTQQDKADFGNTLLHFIDSGFKQTLFTKKFYNRLSMTYGHIAHFNHAGFWEEWFSSDADCVRFIEHLLAWPCYGDPTFTFSDVERALKAEIRRRNYLDRYRAIADASLRAREVSLLEKLEAKYRRSAPADPCVLHEHIERPPPVRPLAPQPGEPVQGTLF